MGMKKVNWEKLSKTLQKALSDEITDNIEKEIMIKDLTLIVHYLETKLGIYKGLDDGNKSV